MSDVCPQCGASLAITGVEGACVGCLLKQVRSQDNLTQDSEYVQDHTFEVTQSYIPREQRHEVAFEAGQDLGDYRIRGRLGKGGMGTVYEADHRSTGRRVALKVLAHSLNNRAARGRFLREGRLAAAINHPNSVYVFGTEEIDGKPVIVMELVAGGTLEQRVRRDGPLNVGEAVDAVLQIVAGLEAAERKGILHRDVKPANCFLDSAGQIKIGDFGLSISTEPNEHLHSTQITQEGTFLGTPAFASPEQLRGEQLDFRSDVYAVGVTLFYLLTGKVPFNADGMVQLLARVLDQQPPSASDLNASVPARLSSIIDQCLAKSPGRRFSSYAQLREALLPFSTREPGKALYGQRFLAGLVDEFCVFLLATLLSAGLWGVTSARYWGAAAIIYMTAIGYFAVQERMWGKTLGKWLFRLAVTQQGDVPGWRSCWVRSAIYVIPRKFPQTLVTVFISLGWFASNGVLSPSMANYLIGALLEVAGLSELWGAGLLFLTARASNGGAAIHDLLSGTRVVSLQRAPAGGVVEKEVEFNREGNLRTVGDYHLLSELHRNDNGTQLFLGYDATLLRRVWIVLYDRNPPAIPAEQKQHARLTRLRWLGGKRSQEENWDCFEAVEGGLLVELVSQQRDWNLARQALHSLTSELTLACNDQTLPKSLCLEQIWVEPSGNVKLLPVHLYGESSTSTIRQTVEEGQVTTSCLAFLAAVTDFCVAQCQVGAATKTRSDLGPPNQPSGVPIPHLTLASRIRSCPSLETALHETRNALNGQARITRLRRVGILFATFGVPLVMFLSYSISGMVMQSIVFRYPELNELKRLLVWSQMLEQQAASQIAPNPAIDEQLVAVKTVIAGDYRVTIDDPQVWESSSRQILIMEEEKGAAESIVLSYHPTPKEIEQARRLVSGEQPAYAGLSVAEVEYFSPQTYFLLGCNFWLKFTWLPSLLTALLFHRGLILRGFECGFVDRRNSPASRLRIFLRMLVPGAPFVLLAILAGTPYGLLFRPETGLFLIGMALILVAGLGVWRKRFVTDRLFGLHLVPA